ncbi:glycoside hydrolase superfamily [Copromyces sp. CBS 386.78]|nr:glycoside hydrolase superfamily [Copromyces sp. CBS 386.78]
MRISWGLLSFPATVSAIENGINGWLRYAPLPSDQRPSNLRLPGAIMALSTNKTSPVYTAGQELQSGIKSILNQTLPLYHEPDEYIGSTILVSTTGEFYGREKGDVKATATLADDGYLLRVRAGNVVILGQTERGALYGAFDYLSRITQGRFSDADLVSNPDAPIRWMNQWDNMDGSIERGYAGPSIFFNNNAIPKNFNRVSQYARLLASIGINGIIVNNVNANANLLTDANIDGLGRIADAMRPYGVQVGISLNFASPQTFGGLSTFDPLDQSVISWWTDKTNRLYKRIPDMAGYLVKANSEGQPGPLTYNRTLADGANLFAKAVQPHGGIVIGSRNHAVEFFKGLDGQFLDNVVVQIKYGPIDFQVREPASPLFANIPQTNTAIELQITQEYLGQHRQDQQSHLVYVAPLWKTILDFDLRADGQPSLVRDVVAGRRFSNKRSGYAGVVNVGTNTTWLGSHLAMSNLYAYGRLAWDPTQDPQALLEDWTRLTFGSDPLVLGVITEISMASWPAYENYTGNLGIQTLTDILYTHYGPNPASQDNNGWGQWTRADHDGLGMDRTVSMGTGFAGQYPAEVAGQFENIETTPDDLLLWFHHVNYTHILKSGKSVIQHFYDAHYAGADTAQRFSVAWESLRKKIDTDRFNDVLFPLRYQAGHSIVWRDSICQFYHNFSGIPDGAGRVGKHEYRIEAETMTLKNYKLTGVNPVETASNLTAVVLISNNTSGEVTRKLDFDSGKYDVAINYFDLIGGKARYKAFLNGKLLLGWAGDLENKLGHAFSTKLDGHSATRLTIQKGDVLKITGVADGNELAPLDYVAIWPQGLVD